MLNRATLFATEGQVGQDLDAKEQQDSPSSGLNKLINELHQISSGFKSLHQALYPLFHATKSDDNLIEKIKAFADSAITHANSVKKIAEDSEMHKGQAINLANGLEQDRWIKSINDSAAEAIVKWQRELESCIQAKEILLNEYQRYQSQRLESKAANASSEEAQGLLMQITELVAANEEKDDQISSLTATVQLCHQALYKENDYIAQLGRKQHVINSLQQRIVNQEQQLIEMQLQHSQDRQALNRQLQLEQYRRQLAEQQLKAVLIAKLTTQIQSYESHLNGCFSFWYRERKTCKQRFLSEILDLLLNNADTVAEQRIDALSQDHESQVTAGKFFTKTANLADEVKQYCQARRASL